MSGGFAVVRRIPARNPAYRSARSLLTGPVGMAERGVSLAAQ
jgi:hypothetical protein